MENNTHKEKISVFWFRRDLRLDDNRGLFEALNGDFPVLPVFIFDEEIINELDKEDVRITYIYECLQKINLSLEKEACSLYCKKGAIEDIWKKIIEDFNVQAVYANEDYEPYSIMRDSETKKFLSEKGIPLFLFKDQVIFAKDDVLKKDYNPYTVFTPYKNRWIEKFKGEVVEDYTVTGYKSGNYVKIQMPFPAISELGFMKSQVSVRDYDITGLENYDKERDFPALDKTSYLSVHLRFGAVSIRRIVKKVEENKSFLGELIWREFFMQILYQFPYVIGANFKSQYDYIEWRNNSGEFEKWKNGETGYPMVDAGMRQLNATGYMHNRVRMVVASFLCKDLLIDWKWGEAYFAKKLLDYELSSNNGNWQWAAGTGCDAAPYFRVFNPVTQMKRYDPDLEYIKKWVPEVNTSEYCSPVVNHARARERAIETYKKSV